MGRIRVIDPQSILDVLNNINLSCENLKSYYNNASNYVNVISDNVEVLKGYDGARAPSDEFPNGGIVKVKEYKWSVTIDENISNLKDNFNTKADDVISDIDTLISELKSNEALIDYINEEIKSMYESLDSEGANAAFESLRRSIAMDGNSAINNKFVNISDNYVQYWTDEPLRFEYDSKSGAYLIYQGSVAMGWTTREGFDNYCKALIEEGKKTEETALNDEEEGKKAEETALNDEEEEENQEEEFEEGEVIQELEPAPITVKWASEAVIGFSSNDTAIQVVNQEHFEKLINKNEKIYIPKNMMLCNENGESLVSNGTNSNGFLTYSDSDGKYIFYSRYGSDDNYYMEYVEKEDMENAKLMHVEDK